MKAVATKRKEKGNQVQKEIADILAADKEE